MNIVGVPCSVSCSGIVGGHVSINYMVHSIKNHEKGLLLFLNTEQDWQVDNVIRARTLPTIVFENRFQTKEEYISALRSHYRRRLMRIVGSFKGVKKKKLECIQFDNEMYDLYLNVLERSQGKLETLSLEFFKNLPQNFSLNCFSVSNKLLGWTISVLDRTTLLFFLGGLNYQFNDRHMTYFNMLFNLVMEGIEDE